MFRRVKILVAILLVAVLTVAAVPGFAVQARFFRNDGDSSYHAQHLSLHVGSRNCKTSGNYIKVRTRAGGSDVIGHLEIADIFTLEEVSGHWAKITVRYSPGTSPDSWAGLSGWVDADYVECPCSEGEYYANTPRLTWSLGIANKNNTHVRERPAKGARSFAKLRANEEVEVISEYTGDDNYVWYRVRYNNTVMGYIRSDRVTITQTGLWEDDQAGQTYPEPRASVGGADRAVSLQGDTWQSAYGNFILSKAYEQIGYPDYLPDGYDVTAMSDGSEKLEYVGYDYDPIWFTLYDLDNNQTPELIIYNGMGFLGGNFCHVYTFSGNAMRYLGKMGRRELMWSYSPDKTYPGLVQTDGNMGYYTTDYWYIRDNQLCMETIESTSEYADPDMTVETDEPIITCETTDANLYAWYKTSPFYGLDHWDYDTLNSRSWEEFVETVYYGQQTQNH